MYVCMYVCVDVSENDSVLTVHSIDLKFDVYITGYCRTNPIDFGECRMHRFLRSTKKNFHALRPM